MQNNETPEDSSKTKDTEDTGSPGLGSAMVSVAAAIFGVQSDKNREKDFKKGDATQFITLGIAATVLILIIMAIIVSQVLPDA